VITTPSDRAAATVSVLDVRSEALGAVENLSLVVGYSFWLISSSSISPEAIRQSSDAPGEIALFRFFYPQK
jgi:hypothetical protein